MKKFSVNIPESTLESIKSKVANFPWDEVDMPEDGGWVYGTNKDYLKELCDYWIKKYIKNNASLFRSIVFYM